MIKIKRTGTNVVLLFETSLELDEGESPVFQFSWNTNSSFCAQLLAERMNKDLEKYLLEIKRDGYHAGYKDGKGHKAKRFL